MEPSFVIGVTGGIATGKSALLAILAELGADRIDADRVYHDLIQPGLPLWERLRRRFGDGIVADDGRVDRKALGDIVFANPAKLGQLDAITHPAVIEEVNARVTNAVAEVVALEAVKLIESGMSSICDEIWLIVAEPAIQRARLMTRTGISVEEADRRLAAQPDEASRRVLADHIIDNSGTAGQLRSAVEARWRSLPWDRIASTTTPILP